MQQRSLLMRSSSILLPCLYASPLPLPLLVWGGLPLTPCPPLCLPLTPPTRTSLEPRVTTHSHQLRDPGHSQTQTSGRCFLSPLLSSLRTPVELSRVRRGERAPLVPSFPRQAPPTSLSFGCTTGSLGMEITHSAQPPARLGVRRGPAPPVTGPHRPAGETLPCPPTQALHGGVV